MMCRGEKESQSGIKIVMSQLNIEVSVVVDWPCDQTSGVYSFFLRLFCILQFYCNEYVLIL